MRKYFLILLMFILPLPVLAQYEYREVSQGNKHYKKKEYVEAEILYRKALDRNPSSFAANYDLANTLYRREKFDDAEKQYLHTLNFAGDDKMRIAKIYHNLGNTYLRVAKPKEALEAYKQALRNNPKDDETRYNYGVAKRMLQNQQEQQNNEQQQNQDKQQNNEQQQNQDKQQQNQDQQQPSQPKENEMSKEDAERILQALRQDEKDTQDKVNRAKSGSRRRVEKDW
ncbi:MAG: tetratricopeptide repeat protein [Paludibacteraceae bacterium]|nr:tetratricopeptide repeat protein [Paludibacteraceae bacterium]